MSIGSDRIGAYELIFDWHVYYTIYIYSYKEIAQYNRSNRLAHFWYHFSSQKGTFLWSSLHLQFRCILRLYLSENGSRGEVFDQFPHWQTATDHFDWYSGETSIMAWIELILSVIVLWFASLFKILLGSSSSSSKAAFLDYGNSCFLCIQSHMKSTQLELWFLVIISLLKLPFQLVFLCILPSANVFVNSLLVFLMPDGSYRRRNVLLVIAHPDDESM